MRLFLLISGIILMTASCTPKQKVDLLLFNGTIYTVDEKFSIVNALVIDSGRVVAAGTEQEIRRHFSGKEEKNLQGKFVYPGLIDPHCHFTGYGLDLQEADLTGTESFNQILEKLKAHAAASHPAWIRGHGWDQNDWPVKSFPFISRLDSAFPDIPVYLTRIDGHAALVNSKALDIASIKNSTRIDGGEILLKHGLLIDNAMDLVMKKIPAYTIAQQVQGLMAAQEKCFSVGLTSVADAGLDKNTILLIDSLQQKGDLKMRINAMINPTPENFEQFMHRGIYKTDRLTVRSVKLYADGALGSRGALLLQPYADQPESRGLMMKPESYYRSICEDAYRSGYQVNTHCIGDSANRFILDLYGSILKGKNDLRWRIEHAQCVDASDVHKFGDFSIIPSIQTTHATSDMYWAEQRLGTRIRDAYTCRRLMEQNGWFPNGSDFPVENINPLYGFYAAVTRQDQKGFPKEGFHPEEAITREQALRAMTIWAAKAAFEEKEKGSLEPGKYADFVITAEDLMQAPKERLFSIPVLQTYSNGHSVWKAN